MITESTYCQITRSVQIHHSNNYPNEKRNKMSEKKENRKEQFFFSIMYRLVAHYYTCNLADKPNLFKSIASNNEFLPLNV